MECDSKRIQRVHLYKPKLAAGFGKRRFRLYHAVFLLCYIYQVIYVVSTIGQPYRQFLEKADREGIQGKYENWVKEYGKYVDLQSMRTAAVHNLPIKFVVRSH
jgi:hypothetical protein